MKRQPVPGQWLFPTLLHAGLAKLRFAKLRLAKLPRLASRAAFFVSLRRKLPLASLSPRSAPPPSAANRYEVWTRDLPERDSARLVWAWASSPVQAERSLAIS